MQPVWNNPWTLNHSFPNAFAFDIHPSIYKILEKSYKIKYAEHNGTDLYDLFILIMKQKWIQVQCKNLTWFICFHGQDIMWSQSKRCVPLNICGFQLSIALIIFKSILMESMSVTYRILYIYTFIIHLTLTLLWHWPPCDLNSNVTLIFM